MKKGEHPRHQTLCAVRTQRACKAHFVPIKRCTMAGGEGWTHAARLGQGHGRGLPFLLVERLGIYRPALRTLSFSWLLRYNPLGQATQELDADNCKIMSLGEGSQSRWCMLNGTVMLLSWPGEGWRRYSGICEAISPSAAENNKIKLRQNNFPDNMMHGG